MNKKPIRTMEQFAETIGVSRPTVSKYFQDPSSVRAKVRKRIELGVEETGFRPNLLAVNLNRRRTRIIGLIFPNSLDPFYMELRRLIEINARAHGYLSFVFSSEANPDLEVEAIETLNSLNAAGVIMAPIGNAAHRAKLKALAHRLPVVFVDVPLDDEEAFVGTDNHQSIDLMVDYLSRFNEPPCYFGGPEVNVNTAEREAAYVSAMKARGLEPVVIGRTPSRSWDFEAYAFDEASRILSNGNFPTKSILCCNDRLAFGILAAAYQNGVKIGIGEDCDLRVAGHDDHPFSRYTVPRLTTAAQDAQGIGRHAVELLFKKIGQPQAESENEAENQIRVGARLVLRESA